MKPTIGRIVIIHQPNGDQIPGIVTVVHTDTCLNVTGFLSNGNVSGFSSLNQKGTVSDGVTCWDWPVKV
jgi:hypothetical protein